MANKKTALKRAKKEALRRAQYLDPYLTAGKIEERAFEAPLDAEALSDLPTQDSPVKKAG